MAITSRQIIDFLLANPSMSDADIVKAMETYGVSPAQMAEAVGLKEGEVAARAAATVPQGQTVTLGDTVVQPVYQVTGSGMDQQVGGLENVITYKATDNQAGGSYTQYTPTGVVEQTGTQQEVKSGLKEFALGAGLLFGLPTLLNAGAATGAAALTTTELAQANMALGGVGGTVGATELASALATGAPTVATTALTGGSGLITGVNAGITAESVAAKLAADAAATGTTGGLLTNTAANTALTNTAANTALTNTAATTAATTAAATTAANTAAATAATAAATGLTTAQVADLVKTGLTTAQIANLFSTGATTAAGLLQQQTSREAAIKAQAMIDRETAAAKASAQFKPIGMTTRFGSSQFGFDPVTGQLTSAGYTLDPQAKNAQDRFVKLAESGLQQAEGAQAQFAPLQTGAQSLFGLGNKYLAQNPQDVAQNYLNQQMALLQPGRELELAALQNKLQQQGRGGLSVAQGGTYGATTPELQALYNARAQQEALLAANAQRAGQQDVLFGAGLLGQGSTAMGNYYAGQQSAYAPYTTALQQVTGLESAAQQPFTLSTGLAEKTSAAGQRVGEFGTRGAGQSVLLATGPAATNNPYASAISGLAANPLFGQYVGGLFGSTPQASLTAGFTPAQIAATEAGYPSLYL